ncbi:MAG: hypothetical protein KDA84_19255 [Planctomycetaceae bacterium]|nr:hypothetical protein [Planctomycetaceae bacterium]
MDFHGQKRSNETAEKDAAIEIAGSLSTKARPHSQNGGADAGSDSGPFLIALEDRQIEPHVAMTKTEPAHPDTAHPDTAPADRKANILAWRRMKDRQTSLGYRISQKVRKKVEECFGWQKTIAGLSRSRFVGRWKLSQSVELSAAA